MKIASVLSTLLLAAAAAGAQGTDPLKSAACGDALASLQTARAAHTAAATLEGLRSSAASICLGAGGPPQRIARIAQPPVSVPPPQIDVTPPAAPLPAPALPPPPLAIQRPPSVAHCDPGGCWADDGTHLQHLGPNLAGPNGLCTQQGGLVYCP